MIPVQLLHFIVVLNVIPGIFAQEEVHSRALQESTQAWVPLPVQVAPQENTPALQAPPFVPLVLLGAIPRQKPPLALFAQRLITASLVSQFYALLEIFAPLLV